MGVIQIVWAEPNQKNPINTLIHEACHVFQHTVAYVGEDKVGNELEAYSIANIAETLIIEFQRQIRENLQPLSAN